MDKQSAGFQNLLLSWGVVKKVDEVKHTVETLKASNLMKLSVLSDKGVLNTRWGNDYTSGLAEAMRKGAVLATTNPPLINNERKENPEYWDKTKENLKQQYPQCSSSQLASIMTMQVVLKNCRELWPVYQSTEGSYGYISLQVSPKNSTDSTGMVEEAEFLYHKLGEELGRTPNVLFKLPGTEASLAAAERLTKKGIGVTITVSFSVDQMLAFAEVIEKGSAKLSFVVMMTGRLDDPIRDELQSLGVEDAAAAARWASTAVTRKAYDLLYRQHGLTKSRILSASLRGPWNIDGAITDGKVPVFITSFPDKTQEYDSLPRNLASRMDEDISQEMLAKLMKSEIFKKAYIAGSMRPCDFDSYYPVSVTLDSFSKSYEEFVQYLER